MAKKPAGGRGAGAAVEVLLVLAAGGAQVDVGVHEAREQVEALPSTASAPSGAAMAPARRSATTPSRTTRSSAVDPRRRVEHPRPVSTTAGGAAMRSQDAHAGRPPAPGTIGPPAPARRLGEQLVEDGHPHHHAGLHLRPMSAWASITSAASSTPRFTGPGVHQQLRGPQAAAVDLVAGRVLAQRGHEGLAMRSRCMRST